MKSELKICSWGVIDNTSTGVQIMAWHQIGDKPSPKPSVDQVQYIISHYSDIIIGRMALITQPFIQAQMKENIKAPRHWHLWGEFTSDRWIPHHNGPVTRKMFPFDVIMTSLVFNVLYIFRHSEDQYISMGFALNTLRSWQNGCHFADDIFKCIFFNESVWISIKISLKFVPKVPTDNKSTLVHVMVWHWTDKSLPEPIITQFTDAYMCHQASVS